MRNPFLFIVGCPRSGTTLLERIINAHPLIAIVMGNPAILHRFEKGEGLTPDGFVTPEFAEGGRFPGFASRDEFAGFVRELLQAGRPVSYANLVAQVSDRYGKAKGKPLVGYKSESTGHKRQYGVPRIQALHGLWPGAKIVHIIRDGRDVCLSVNSWRKAPDIAEGFSTWKEDPVATAALWWEWQVRLKREEGSRLAPGLYWEIRYESLVSRPEDECRALCDFLGVPYDDAMLRFHEDRKKDDPDLDAKHAWRPVTPGLRDWRTQMPTEDVERFEVAAGACLDELDYPRGISTPRTEALDHAARIRGLFEGRPLPERWP